MQFDILSIVLWPRKAGLPARTVDFAPGMVNVITGASQTGKSAIIPIIDYCLGSDKCTIPVRTIRDSCSWFGVLVQTVQGQKLFARREPGVQRSTDDMFVIEGSTIDVSQVAPERKIGRESVKQLLDEISGLSRLSFDTESTGVGFSHRPSFRDMQAFTIQPQNIVANPNVLFFKADTFEHREKLKTIFPYVLNAVSPQVLALQHEHAQLSRELRRKQNDLKNVRQVSDRWLAQIRTHVVAARELGLLRDPVLEQATQRELMDLLRAAIKAPIQDAIATEASLSEALAELDRLRTEENEISSQLTILRRRLAQMDDLRQATLAYKGALTIQRERLHVSRWLNGATSGEADCPICGTTLGNEDQRLRLLIHALEDVEETTAQIGGVSPALEREYEQARSDARLMTERLAAVRSRMNALSHQSDEAAAEGYSTANTARFVGAASQAIEFFSAVGEDSSLAAEVVELEERVRSLQEAITQNGVRDRLDRALSVVQLNVGRILPSLDAEFPDSPVELRIDDLSVRVVGTERSDYLWELGSGANWLSYHIAVTLALQEYFLAQNASPVPAFLVYDQPSQVYFPHKGILREGDNLDPELQDEDIDAVRKVFQALANSVAKAQGRLQVIVLDHADSSVWGGIPPSSPS